MSQLVVFCAENSEACHCHTASDRATVVPVDRPGRTARGDGGKERTVILRGEGRENKNNNKKKKIYKINATYERDREYRHTESGEKLSPCDGG